MQIKLSEFVAQYLVDIGVDAVFAVSGGASLHLIHAIGDNPNIQYITPHHEQAAAMAADGYARTKKNTVGVAIATSGPGATNLITGMCCSFYDSVPVLFLTGQVSTFRMVGQTGVRQIGFQETPIVEICKPITKYAVTISNPQKILFELQKAIHFAKSGRPGPVLIDIPDDLQRTMVDTKNLVEFVPPPPKERGVEEKDQITRNILDLILSAQKPIIVGGWGLHLSGEEKRFLEFAETLNIPIVLTWGGADLVNHKHVLYVGTFGSHGMRSANFTIQNADLVISLGSRLDTKSTGTPVNTFSKGSQKIIVDIDDFELKKFEKFGLTVDLLVNEDLRNFFNYFNFDELKKYRKDYTSWNKSISSWKSKSEEFDDKFRGLIPGLNPYSFIEKLSVSIKNDARIFVDTGCSVAWMMQAGKFNGESRVFHDFNNTAMGWALPAAIGSHFANPIGQIICVIGDGSLMMTLHELATLKHHKIPLQIFLMNNSGYSMIKQTQDQWLDSKYYASSHEGGLSFPSYAALAQAFELRYYELSTEEMLNSCLQDVCAGPTLYNVIISSTASVIPQVKFGHPNEDMEPLLPRDEFRQWAKF
jgi:acetolactate synthase I/II/III large subunit